MAYATHEDLLRFLSLGMQADLTVDDGSEEPDTDLIDAVLDAASREIDGYLVSQVAVPASASAYPVLSSWTLRLARYRLLERRGHIESHPALHEDYKLLRADLSKVAEGKLRIAPATGSPATNPSTVRFSEQPQSFTLKNIGDF